MGLSMIQSHGPHSLSAIYFSPILSSIHMHVPVTSQSSARWRPPPRSSHCCPRPQSLGLCPDYNMLGSPMSCCTRSLSKWSHCRPQTTAPVCFNCWQSTDQYSIIYLQYEMLFTGLSGGLSSKKSSVILWYLWGNISYNHLTKGDCLAKPLLSGYEFLDFLNVHVICYFLLDLRDFEVP